MLNRLRQSKHPLSFRIRKSKSFLTVEGQKPIANKRNQFFKIVVSYCELFLIADNFKGTTLISTTNKLFPCSCKVFHFC